MIKVVRTIILTAIPTIRSNNATIPIITASFSVKQRAINIGITDSMHKTTPAIKIEVWLDSYASLFSFTIPSTPYAVSISSFSRNLNASSLLLDLINKATAAATIKISTLTPIPPTAFSDMFMAFSSCKPPSKITVIGDQMHSITPRAILGAYNLRILRNSEASSRLTFLTFLGCSTLSLTGSPTLRTASSFNR